MPEPSQTCSTCKFWVKSTPAETDIRGKAMGCCHRYPPFDGRRFTKSSEEDWCGEHAKAKP